MTNSARLLATAAMLLSQMLTNGASAASVPILSGPYNVMTSTVCQASVPQTQTEVDVPGGTTTIITIDPNETTYTGGLGESLLSVTFHDGSFTATGTSWGAGDLVFTGTDQGAFSGLNPASISSSGTYTNTATQLTLSFAGGGGSITFQVLYSDFFGDQARYLHLVDVYGSGTSPFGCIDQGTAVYAGRSTLATTPDPTTPDPTTLGPTTPGLSK